MSERKLSRAEKLIAFSGNRFSLRSKASDQIKKVDSISNRLGALGDILVSTWGGIMMGIVTLGIGGFMIFNAVRANGGATALKNLLPIFMTLFGSGLIALNVMMTNPSLGSQVFVSLRFLIRSITNQSEKRKTLIEDNFRFYKDDPNKEIVETTLKGKSRYFLIYQVRGVISPVTFENELRDVASLNRQLLSNLERDTILVTINSVQNTQIQKKKMPQNATENMMKRKELMYKIGTGLPHNQKMKSVIVIVAPDVNVLRVRKESLENVFNQGMVIDYLRLRDKEAKKEVYNIFGAL